MRRNLVESLYGCSHVLHIAKHMVQVCTVEKLEVHPHAENVRPQGCAHPEVGDRLVFPSKNVLNR